MWFAPSSTGVDTVAGAPVGVIVQFALNVVPLKFTECTVAFRLKMILSGVATPTALQLSGHGIPLSGPAPVQLHGAVLAGVCVTTVPSLTLIAFSVPGVFVPT